MCTSLILLIPRPSTAAPLLADLSNYHITMDASFNGTRMFIFGTRAEPGDVVVTVRGPLKNYVVRKKKEIAGIWVNAERIKLFNVPDFYALATSKPLSEMKHHAAFKQLAIGHEHLFTTGAEATEFTDAFIAHQESRGLFQPVPYDLSFMGETLFKTVIEFPDTIPPGKYNAEITLLADNSIVGTHVLPIEVKKIGIDAFLYDYAHNQPLFYGITAVVMALCAGWFAGRLFERF